MIDDWFIEWVTMFWLAIFPLRFYKYFAESPHFNDEFGSVHSSYYMYRLFIQIVSVYNIYVSSLSHLSFYIITYHLVFWQTDQSSKFQHICRDRYNRLYLIYIYWSRLLTMDFDKQTISAEPLITGLQSDQDIECKSIFPTAPSFDDNNMFPSAPSYNAESYSSGDSTTLDIQEPCYTDPPAPSRQLVNVNKRDHLI